MRVEDDDTTGDGAVNATVNGTGVGHDGTHTVVGDKGAAKPTQAERLVQLALTRVDLVRDRRGSAYAGVHHNGGHTLVNLRSDAFDCWLTKAFHDAFGKVPSKAALGDARRLLAAFAQEGPAIEVSPRLAIRDGKIYLDLANERHEVIEITGERWTVTQEGPFFVRPTGMLPLPTPVAGGSLDELRDLVNVDPSQFVLLAGWLVGCLQPGGPYAILLLVGEEGTAKTTLARLLRALIDPNEVPVRPLPATDRDLAIAATNAHLLAFDNLSASSCRDRVSDSLCRVATRGGFATRLLFSNGDEALFNFAKPMVLTSIDDVASRADLASRCIAIHPTPIAETDRKLEREIFAEFDARLPRLLGALCSAVSCALANRDTVRLDVLPRLADFALFVTAAETAIGLRPGEFVEAMRANRRLAVHAVLDADPVIAAVRALMTRVPEWKGTATRLLEVLREYVDDNAQRSPRWPRAANVLTNSLRRAQSSLQAVGVQVVVDRSATERQVILRVRDGDRHDRHDRQPRRADDDRDDRDDDAGY